MVDKGFTVRDQLSAVDVDLNTPSLNYVAGGEQLTEAEILHMQRLCQDPCRMSDYTHQKFCNP